MLKKCEICSKEFNIIDKGYTRKYCYECSPRYIKGSNISKAQQISCIRKAMKKQAVLLKGGKCEVCGYDKCIDALVFHHLNPEEKEFRLANGETRSWERYWNEAQKCKLLCANCHAEEHWKLNNNN